MKTNEFIIYLQGDSGGPVTFKLRGQHILIGVIGFFVGEECGNITGVCRISYVREWIDRILSGGGAAFCPNGSDAED